MNNNFDCKSFFSPLLKSVFAVLSPILIIICACQTTSFLQDFKTLRIGMDKSDVVEALGTPKKTERKEEKDWWYYSVFENTKNYERLVVFKDNKMIYAGRVPNLNHGEDADTIDKKNEELNRAVEAQNERDRVSAVPIQSAPVVPEEKK